MLIRLASLTDSSVNKMEGRPAIAFSSRKWSRMFWDAKQWPAFEEEILGKHIFFLIIQRLVQTLEWKLPILAHIISYPSCRPVWEQVCIFTLRQEFRNDYGQVKSVEESMRGGAEGGGFGFICVVWITSDGGCHSPLTTCVLPEWQGGFWASGQRRDVGSTRVIPMSSHTSVTL